MIKNFPMMLPMMINVLEQSSYTFYPTGSRYFGGKVNPDSDWDFIAADSIKIREFLEELGFKTNIEESYSDTSIATVFSYYGDPLIDKGLSKIDIQLTMPGALDDKLNIQNILMGLYGNTGIPGDKDARRTIWYVSLCMLNQLRDAGSVE